MHSLKTDLKQALTLNYTYAKVNRYENVQPPGNLWYHDHAMDMTAHNVFNGLAGNYIIYDPDVEKHMPSSKNNMFIIAGQFMINNTIIGETDGGSS